MVHADNPERRRFAQQQSAKVDAVFKKTEFLNLRVGAIVEDNPSRKSDARYAFQIVYELIASLRYAVNEFYRTDSAELVATFATLESVLGHIETLLSSIEQEFDPNESE